MNQSQEINELACALSKAQGDITAAIKDSANPFYKSKYANLIAVWNACRAPLSKNGLAVIQTFEVNGPETILITTLAHASGQWIKSFMPIISIKREAQEIGKACTYMRRYALSAICGVAPDDDDDGNSADGHDSKQKFQKNTPVQTEPLPSKEFISDGDIKQIVILLDGNDELLNKLLSHYQVMTLSHIEKRHMKNIITSCLNAKKEREAKNGQG